MPITKSAKKALRSSKRKRVFNIATKEKMNKAVKAVKKVAQSKSKEASKIDPQSLSLAFKALDKAVKKGVIKKNTASRKKSRLSKMLKKVSS